MWNYATETLAQLCVGSMRHIANPDCIIQFGKVYTHATWETVNTWESLQHRDMKLSFISDEHVCAYKYTVKGNSPQNL